MLRAQLELNRLRQRRVALEAQETGGGPDAEPAPGQPMDEPIATAASVRCPPVPELVTPDAAVADALARSPELAQARLGTARAEKSVALARRERSRTSA